MKLDVMDHHKGNLFDKMDSANISIVEFEFFTI